MIFVYGYKTRENETCEGRISASSRDAVFAALKKQGIRPFRVALAPGFFNKLMSYGKRWFAIVLMAVVIVLLSVYKTKGMADKSSAGPQVESETRRQVIGDSAVIEKGIRDGWANVFEGEGERFLASFAIPGVQAGLRNTLRAEIEMALGRTILPKPDDSIEARQIKSMVEGMKRELRRYLKDGGTIVEYGQELVRRQESEIKVFDKAQQELDAAVISGSAHDEIEALWEKKNQELRRMGIRPLPIPETE